MTRTGLNRALVHLTPKGSVSHLGIRSLSFLGTAFFNVCFLSEELEASFVRWVGHLGMEVAPTKVLFLLSSPTQTTEGFSPRIGASTRGCYLSRITQWVQGRQV